MGKRLSAEERQTRRCSNCGQPQILARGLCSVCYNWQRRYGTARPADIKSRRPIVPLHPCHNCGQPSKPLTRGFCRTCYERWYRTGSAVRRERKPQALPPPPAPEEFFFAMLTEGYTGRWPGRAATGDPGPRAPEVRGLLEKVSERERYVLVHLFGLDGKGRRAYNEVSAALGVTRQRVCQIQREALRKLRRDYRRGHAPPLPSTALEELEEQLRAEQALIVLAEDTGGRTWEAGMVAGLRIGKQAAYDVALALVDEVRARYSWDMTKEERTR